MPKDASKPIIAKVAAIQLVSSTSLEENLQQTAGLVAQAADQGAQLVLLPEYFCFMGAHDHDKLALKEPFGNGPIQNFLAKLAKTHKIWLAGGTLPIESPDKHRIYNSLLVFAPDASVQARYDKIHLFGLQTANESFNEADTILPGASQAQRFDMPWGQVGLSICYDLRFPELYRAMAGVQLILVPSAFTYTTGKAHWEVLLRARAIENQCYVLAAAQGGRHENGRRTWGHSMLVDPWGKVVSQLPEGPGVLFSQINLSYVAKVRQRLPALHHKVM